MLLLHQPRNGRQERNHDGDRKDDPRRYELLARDQVRRCQCHRERAERTAARKHWLIGRRPSRRSGAAAKDRRTVCSPAPQCTRCRRSRSFPQHANVLRLPHSDARAHTRPRGPPPANTSATSIGATPAAASRTGCPGSMAVCSWTCASTGAVSRRVTARRAQTPQPSRLDRPADEGRGRERH
jgi:hypothetical protein